MPDDPGPPGGTICPGRIVFPGGAVFPGGTVCPGATGPGITGIGFVGVGCAGAGCIGRTMAGPPGFKVCPGIFKTTIKLIIVRNSSVRTFLLFTNFSVLLFVFGRRQHVLAFSISAQITGRADHLPMG